MDSWMLATASTCDLQSQWPPAEADAGTGCGLHGYGSHPSSLMNGGTGKSHCWLVAMNLLVT